MTKEKKSSKDLNKKINELTRENTSLKKKLGKLRKDVNQSQDALIINQEYASQILVEEKREKIKKCDYCSGDIKKFKIRNSLFEICQLCKSRKKVVEEKTESQE